MVAIVYRLLDLLGLGHVPVGVGPLYTTYEWGLEHTALVGCPFTRFIPQGEQFKSSLLYGAANELLPHSHRRAFDAPSSTRVYQEAVDRGVDAVLTLGPLTSLRWFQVEGHIYYTIQ